MGFYEWIINIIVSMLIKLGILATVPTDLSTLEFVQDYMEEAFDLTMDGEDEIFESSIPYQKEKNEYGFYGGPMSTVEDGENMVIGMISMVECRVVDEYEEVTGITDPEKCRKAWGKIKDGKCMRPSSGHIKFSFRFDPNNGFIYMLYIHPDFVTPKTKAIADKYYGQMKPAEENPDFDLYHQPVKER